MHSNSTNVVYRMKNKAVNLLEVNTELLLKMVDLVQLLEVQNTKHMETKFDENHISHRLLIVSICSRL